MRKGEELITAKGTYDLPPAIEDALAGYCIQDVDLTYAIYQQLLPEYPQTELDIIDLTCRMFCEPKMRINVEKLEQFVNAERCASEKAIDDSGIDRKFYPAISSLLSGLLVRTNRAYQNQPIDWREDPSLR